MNLLLLLAHSIEEHDQLKLLSGLGYDVFSIGGYIDPQHPHDDKRPALDIPAHPDLQAVVDGLGTEDNLKAAKEHIPDALLDWADAVIVHHYEHEWILPDWPRLKASGKRIIWRTVGQSVEYNERLMAPLHRDGLEIVRYSPKERNLPGYAGEDALIRFYKDPDEWCGWTGDGEYVLNITQHLRQRDPYTNWRFWEAATQGLPRLAAGPGSEVIGGPGQVTFDQMQTLLREARCYLYTGTQPASYTLGLIEAMMTGVPVVSIGPEWMGLFPYSPRLFEGHEIVDGLQERVGTRLDHLGGAHVGDPETAHTFLAALLDDHELASEASLWMRHNAITLFGKATIGQQWKAYLG